MEDLSELPRLSEVVAAGRTALASKSAGLSFARLVKAMILAKDGGPTHLHEIASQRWPGDTSLLAFTKSAMAAGSLSANTWAAPLIGWRTLAGEFISAARASSILLRLTAARKIPFLVRLPRVTASSVVGWAGESAPKIVSEMKLDSISLGEAKVAGIVAISMELARSSSPSAELVVRQDLIDSTNAFVDGAFIDPANVASATHPGSILSGVVPVLSSGSDAAAITADLGAVIAGMLGAGGQLVSPVALMSPALAVRLSLLRDTSGAAFPGLTVSGGTVAGLPAMTSTAVPSDIIAIVDQDNVLLADDGAVAIEVSGQASVILDSAPAPGAAPTSFWQEDLVGIKAERFCNWAPRRAPGACAGYVDGIS